MNTLILTKKAKKVISDIIYLDLATSDKKNQPWNTPVYTAYDKDYNFYWLSWKESQHSKNIRVNNKAFIVIYNSKVPEGKGFGVYMQGKAYQLDKTKEIKNALKMIYSRKNKKPRKPEEFSDTFPRRVYKFVPNKVWTNSDTEVKGNFIDNRIDISAKILKK